MVFQNTNSSDLGEQMQTDISKKLVKKIKFIIIRCNCYDLTASIIE